MALELLLVLTSVKTDSIPYSLLCYLVCVAIQNHCISHDGAQRMI